MKRRYQKESPHDSKAKAKEALLFAAYIVETNATVRKTAKHFNTSKTRVHSYITSKQFKHFYPNAESEVREILNKHKAERAFLGGNATKLKYEKLRLLKINK